MCDNCSKIYNDPLYVKVKQVSYLLAQKTRLKITKFIQAVVDDTKQPQEFVHKVIINMIDDGELGISIDFHIIPGDGIPLWP